MTAAAASSKELKLRSVPKRCIEKINATELAATLCG
jgi:hypothetical protein